MANIQQIKTAENMVSITCKFNSSLAPSFLAEFPHFETMEGGTVLFQYRVKATTKSGFPETTVTATIGPRGGKKIISERVDLY